MPKGPGYTGLRLRFGTGLPGFPHILNKATKSLPAQYKPFLSLSRAACNYKTILITTKLLFGFIDTLLVSYCDY